MFQCVIIEVVVVICLLVSLLHQLNIKLVKRKYRGKKPWVWVPLVWFTVVVVSPCIAVMQDVVALCRCLSLTLLSKSCFGLVQDTNPTYYVANLNVQKI